MTRKTIHYTLEQLEFVKDNCTLVIAELHNSFCQKFGRTDVSKDNLNALRKRNGWKTGRTGRFEKGQARIPNSGAKGPNKTSFKKGQMPANTKPLYSERTRDDGFVEIKIPEPNPYTKAKTRYRLKHLWIWEKSKGAIPKNHVVTFKDGNNKNCDLSNLELLPCGVNGMIKRPKFKQLHEEIKPVVKTLALLQHKTQMRSGG